MGLYDFSNSDQTSGFRDKSDYLRKTSRERYSTKVQWAAYNNSPFLKVLGVDEFGAPALNDLKAFGAATPAGKMIEVVGGGYQESGSVFTEKSTPFYTTPLSNWGPEYVEGGTQYAYAWCQMAVAEQIPVEYVDDNAGGLIPIKMQKQDRMKQSFLEELNEAILGSNGSVGYSSGAEGARVFTAGPGVFFNDLPNQISVTQTRTVGGIAKTNSFWQNGSKSIASIGGGGELDRPITMRRSMLDGMNDQAAFAEVTPDYVGVCTQGFWQYYDRLGYAHGEARGGDTATIARYDAAGVQHFAFNGQPLVWDPAVQVPFGATAGTECCYMIHKPSYKISIKSSANFDFSGWEAPREHDLQKAWVATLKLRYMPMITNMRAHLVYYNLPANPD